MYNPISTRRCNFVKKCVETSSFVIMIRRNKESQYSQFAINTVSDLINPEIERLFNGFWCKLRSQL